MDAIKRIDSYLEHLPLLLEADPSEAMIERYIHDGDIYGCFVGGQCACIAVVLPLPQGGCELKNIATDERSRCRGHAGRMLEYLFERYSSYGYMLVGTSDAGVAFYERFGFEVSHKVEGFFIDNYEQPLIENGEQCTDMIYLKRALA